MKRLMTIKMSNINVASVKHIFLASLDLPNISQRSILILCMVASTVKKVSPEENIIKSMKKIVATKQQKTESLVVINVKEQWGKIKIKIVRRPNNMGHHPIY